MPRPLRRRIAGDRPRIDGRTLDPDIALVAARTARFFGDHLEVEKARAGERQLYAVTDLAPRRGVATHDRTIGGAAGPLPVRIYYPPGRSGVSPAIVWFHAGGYTIGGLHTSHGWCSHLSGNPAISGTHCRT